MVNTVAGDAPQASRAPVQAQLIERARDLLRGRAAAVQEHLALAKKLKAVKQFSYARRLLALARAHEGFVHEPDNVRHVIVQQLALCTYKDDDLPVEERLTRALDVLSSLGDLSTTTDQETLGIAGGIFKRRWEQDGNRVALERSLACYQRGYEIGNPNDASYDLGYTGINAAFVLDLLAVEEERAARDIDGVVELAQSRHARADRIRRDLVDTLRAVVARTENAHLLTNWWLLVTLGEAAFGLGDYDEAKRWLSQATALPGVADWEFESTARQLARVAQLRATGGTPTPEALAALHEFLKGSADAVLGAVEGKVGLALSGGGFRASLFHIGVLARLADADLLRRVEVISCVSGGSIIGAHYYLELKHLLQEKADADITQRDFIEIVLRIEREFLLGVQANIRMQMFADPVAALKTAFTGVYSRSERVGELYEKHLFSRVKDGNDGPRYINDLFIRPKGAGETFSPKLHNWGRLVKVPMLVINAATLNTGHAWQFTASWMGEPPSSIDTAIDTNDRLRRMYYNEAPSRYRTVRLGLAVASSSCVPGLFDPVVLDGLFPGRTIRLVDGGVCDNQGVAALLEQDCSLLLVSDASGQMTSEPNPSAGTLGSVLRSSGISQERVRLAQYQDLLARKRLSRVRDLLFVHLRKDLDSEPIDWIDCQDPLIEATPRRKPLTTYGIRKDIQAQLAGLRTDLDSFSDVEAFALMTSGYRMVDTELSGALAHLPIASSPPTPWRFLAIEKALSGQDVEDLRKVLDVGKLLFLKPWALVRWLRYATFSLAVAIALLLGLFTLRVFGSSRLTDVPAIAAVVLGVVVVVLIGLGLSAFRRPAVVAVRVLKSASLLAFALVARVYLWVFDRLFLKVGEFRSGHEPRRP